MVETDSSYSVKFVHKRQESEFTITQNGNTVEISSKHNGLDSPENKKYTITFYIKLEVDKIPEDVRAEYETLNTNGSSIDSKDDSMGSSFIEFGDQKVELESPSIDSQLLYNVTLHPEGGTILQSAYVDSYQSGIGCKLPSVNEIYKPGFSFNRSVF